MEKTFANHIFDKGLIPKLYKELIQVNQKQKKRFKNEQNKHIHMESKKKKFMKNLGAGWE